MKQKVKHILTRRPKLKLRMPKIPGLGKNGPSQTLQQAIQGIPRITNETVAEHREEVLSSARKYIYPLQHSAHRVVIISVSLLATLVILFFAYCTLALYKFHASSTFIYRVTQVIPFPIAKAGPRYVTYENYLFELRHYIHYYQTQQRVDFNSESGKQQLAEFRKRAMDIVVNDAYVKQVAATHDISVSDRELDDAIRLVRSQNRLGSNDQVFEDVLKEFWGWSTNDFRRELRQQMLAQKVVSTLDTATQARAKEAYNKIKNGEDFASVAKLYSDDASTRDNGGDYGFVISQSDRDLPPQVIDAMFRLRVGETSAIINTGNSLEIVKVREVSGDKVRASHVVFGFKPIATYTDSLRSQAKPRLFTSQ